MFCVQRDVTVTRAFSPLVLAVQPAASLDLLGHTPPGQFLIQVHLLDDRRPVAALSSRLSPLQQLLV